MPAGSVQGGAKKVVLVHCCAACCTHRRWSTLATRPRLDQPASIMIFVGSSAIVWSGASSRSVEQDKRARGADKQHSFKGDNTSAGLCAGAPTPLRPPVPEGCHREVCSADASHSQKFEQRPPRSASRGSPGTRAVRRGIAHIGLYSSLLNLTCFCNTRTLRKVNAAGEKSRQNGSGWL